MTLSSLHARRAGEAHALLAQAGKGDGFPVTIARAIALATGIPHARGFFFHGARGRIAPVGIADDGSVETRSVPGSLDTERWAIGDKRSGNAPFGYVAGGWLTVQLRVGTDVVGGAVVQCRGLIPEDDRLLRLTVDGVAAHAAMMIGLRSALADAERAAATDALTGITSRGAFLAQLTRTARSRRDPYIVILADLDGLKAVNDTHGHAAGDRMIKDAAHALSRTIRGDETVGRLGGDEFAAFCRAEADEAPIIIERMKAALAEVGVSASIGWATLEDDGDAALNAADTAMYAEKAARKRARMHAVGGLRP